MKKVRYFLKPTLALFIFQVLMAFSASGQTPDKMSYQAVIRNASNQLLSNQNIGMQISILQGSASGTPVYVERHFPTSNTNGLVSIEIGSGTVVSGDFSAIDWSNGPYFIKSESDPNGGSNYSISSISQLLSVPYALYATDVENDQVNDADADPGNELQDIQDLSLSGTVLTVGIEKGNTKNVELGPLGNDWKLNGNAGTQNGTNFIGTSDSQALDIRTNNVIRTRITTKGQIELLNTGNSVFIGEGAGANDDLSDNQNTFIGYQSGNTNSTGYYNSANGYRALFFNTTGNRNTASGAYSLYSNTTGEYNSGNGYASLHFNTTGSYNSASGYKSLYSNKNGNYNSANGSKALYSNTSGSNNSATGYQALLSSASGWYNSANGYQALLSTTTGWYNSALGSQALKSNTTGDNNSAVGSQALYSNTSGDYNTAIGFRAGYNGASYTNRTAIGYNAQNTASNQVRIGDNTVTSIGGQVAWTALSDARFKKDVRENVAGLDFILKLRPVTYHLNMDAIARFMHTPDSLRLFEAEQEKGKMLQSGFIAQEVEAVAKECGFDFSGVDQPKNENDFYGLRYAEFVVPLVKGMQEQQTLIEQQRGEIETLKNRVDLMSNEKVGLNAEMSHQIELIKEQQESIEVLEGQIKELKSLIKNFLEK